MRVVALTRSCGSRRKKLRRPKPLTLGRRPSFDERKLASFSGPIAAKVKLSDEPSPNPHVRMKAGNAAGRAPCTLSMSMSGLSWLPLSVVDDTLSRDASDLAADECASESFGTLGSDGAASSEDVASKSTCDGMLLLSAAMSNGSTGEPVGVCPRKAVAVDGGTLEYGEAVELPCVHKSRSVGSIGSGAVRLSNDVSCNGCPSEGPATDPERRYAHRVQSTALTSAGGTAILAGDSDMKSSASAQHPSRTSRR
mmetsp:Transcript_1193/g.3900  ORF Transcript_1193/g.3900 Transcript_1193/m.3900 type:complete len:253 (-) Transcript_1193:1960-2718(-)